MVKTLLLQGKVLALLMIQSFRPMPPKTTDGPSSQTTSKILRLMVRNFFIWLLPGVVIFALSLAILLILMVASAVVDAQFNSQSVPKGLISFLGISYLLAGVVFLALPFILSNVDPQSLVFIIGAAIAAWILAYHMLRSEWQRLAALV